jgi:hypothetical protein
LLEVPGWQWKPSFPFRLITTSGLCGLINFFLLSVNTGSSEIFIPVAVAPHPKAGEPPLKVMGHSKQSYGWEQTVKQMI